MNNLDLIWFQAWNTVEGAVVAVFDIFVYLVASFTNAFELLLSLTIVNFVVIRLLSFTSHTGGAGSDVVRKSLPGGKK